MRDEDLHPKKKSFNDDVELAARMKSKQKKDSSKVKLFNYGKMGHFLLRYLMKKKGDNEKRKGKQVASVATSAEIDDLTRRLEEEDFAMISHFSHGTINEDGWYVDSGAMKHMTRSQEVFETLAEWDSKLHMVLGNESQLEIRGSDVVPFRMETRRVIQVEDVLLVPRLRYSVIFVWMMGRKGFEVLFQDGKARLKPKGSKSNVVVLGIREHGFYRLTRNPVDHGKKQVEQVQDQEKQEQVQVLVQTLEEQVQVPEKKVHLPEKVQVPETQREFNLRGSLQIQRETPRSKKSAW